GFRERVLPEQRAVEHVENDAERPAGADRYAVRHRHAPVNQRERHPIRNEGLGPCRAGQDVHDDRDGEAREQDETAARLRAHGALPFAVVAACPGQISSTCLPWLSCAAGRARTCRKLSLGSFSIFVTTATG